MSDANRRSESQPSPISDEVFKRETLDWARRIGVEPKEIRIRQMTRKWASCSTAGRLTFDRDLLSQSDRSRAEVVVHELLHLKVPNHGKLFKALLRAYLRQTGLKMTH